MLVMLHFLLLLLGSECIDANHLPGDIAIIMEDGKEDLDGVVELAEMKLVEKKMMSLMEELEKEFGRDRGEGIVSLCWKGGKVNGGISTGVRGGIWRQEG